MAQFAAELFIQCVYSPELSYDDLLETEGALKVDLTEILEQAGGDFIHFEEMGDTMRAQCAFGQCHEALFHSLCGKIASLMDGKVEARLLFVDKDLDGAFFYTVSNDEWQEASISLPAAGPLTEALREQDPPRK